MVFDEESAERLYNQLRLVKSDEVTRLSLRMKVVHIKTSYHMGIDG